MQENNYVQPIFVSSTFRDMQAERDMIRDRVAPVLAEYASAYGRIIDLIDLRWGVDTASVSEAEASGKVLYTCFDEIDRSRPFFVVLLGGRYGWIPDAKDVSDTLSYLDFQLDDLAQSVTALEIEYGALHARQQPVCFFYFREQLLPQALPEEQRPLYFDGPEGQQRLEALKQAIRDRFGQQVKPYFPVWKDGEVAGLDDLQQMMVEDIRAALLEQWGPPPLLDAAWQQQEQRAQDSYRQVRQRRFTGRQAELAYLLRHAQGAEEGASEAILMVQADSGSGKSTLLGGLMRQLEKSKQCLLLPCFCGVSARSATVQDLLRMMIWRLNEYFGRTDDSADLLTSFAELREQFIWMLGLAAQRTPVVLVVDALDQLLPEPEATRLLWLQDLPARVRVVCSVIDGEEMDACRRLGGTVWQLPALQDTDIDEIVRSLAGSYHKQIDARVVAGLRNKKDADGNPAAQNPLYLTLMVQELVMMNRYDHAKIDEYIASGMKAEDVIASYMQNLVNQSDGTAAGEYLAIVDRIAEMMDGDFVLATLTMLASSRYGLREADLAGAMRILDIPWSTADFAWLRQLLREHLVQGDAGQWDFTHQILRTAMMEAIDDESIKEINAAIIQYFFDVDDAFSNRELMHHLWMMDVPEIAGEIIASQYPIYSEAYARGLADIAAQGRYHQPDGETDLTWPEGFVLDTVLAPGKLLNEDGTATCDSTQRAHMGQFVFAELAKALPTNTRPEYRIRLLEAACEMLRADPSGEKENTMDALVALALCSCLQSLGRLYLQTGNPNKAQERMRQALQLAEVLTEDDVMVDFIPFQRNLALSLEALGDYYHAMPQPISAVVQYAKALEVLQRLPDVPDAKDARVDLGRLKMKHAEEQVAAGNAQTVDETVMQEAVAQMEEAYADSGRDEDAINLAVSYFHKAQQAVQQEQEDGVALMQQAEGMLADIYRRSGSIDVLRCMLTAHLVLGNYSKGERQQKYFEQAVEEGKYIFNETRLADDLSRVSDAWFYQAQLLEREEKYKEALQLYQQAYEGYSEAYGHNKMAELLPRLAIAAKCLAGCYIDLDELDAAGNWLEKWADLCFDCYDVGVQGPIAPGNYWELLDKVIDAYATTGKFLVEIGQVEKGYQYLRQRIAYTEMIYDDSIMNSDDETPSRDAVLYYSDANLDMALAMESAGDYKDALEYHKKNCDILHAYYDSTHSAQIFYMCGMAVMQLADGFTNMDAHKEANIYYIAAHQMFENLFSAQNMADVLQMFGIASKKLARNYRALGDNKLSRQYMQQALDIFKALEAQSPGECAEQLEQTRAEMDAWR